MVFIDIFELRIIKLGHISPFLVCFKMQGYIKVSDLLFFNFSHLQSI